MQCSAWRPTSSASTSVRPLSSSTRWNSCGPSPARTPVHSDVYGFIRSAVEERGSSCRKTSRSRHSGSTFSIPITRDQHLAAASCTCGRCPRTRRRRPCRSRRSRSSRRRPPPAPTRNFSRRCRRAASAIAVASQPEVLALGDRALEQRADLGAVAVDRRHEDVRLLRRRASWTISSARSVSIAWMPCGRERLVEPDLVGGERLDLDHLVARRGRARCRRRSRSPRRRRAPSARRRPRACTDASSRSSCSGSVAIARALIAAPASRSASQSAARRPRARACRGSSSSPCRGCGAAGRRASASRAPRPGSRVHSCAARISARCIVAHAGALAPQRAADVHQARVVGRRADLRARVEHVAQLVGEHRHRGVGVLDRERPAEAAALAARPSSSTRSIPRTARSSRSGRSPTCSSRSEWQVGW